ncbi:hypothetical protein AYO38_10310 [bacterium SCGC AG-212-C10]|nr:hypothetical protein AYO38_10310 [bacterium SCGC AG-212-C10]
MAWGGQSTILIVDDDPTIRTLMGRLANLLGFDAETAANGAEGVAAFLAARGNYACVLLDAMMPVMAGPEALEEMRRINRRTPVVCVSGHPQDDLQALFGECQPDVYLSKPCQGDDLRHAIERAAGRHLEFATV